jgi:hypothetical protein
LPNKAVKAVGPEDVGAAKVKPPAVDVMLAVVVELCDEAVEVECPELDDKDAVLKD